MEQKYQTKVIDLVMKTIQENLSKFRNKVKKPFEVISLISNYNFEKVKKLILKRCIQKNQK